MSGKGASASGTHLRYLHVNVMCHWDGVAEANAGILAQRRRGRSGALRRAFLLSLEHGHIIDDGARGVVDDAGARAGGASPRLQCRRVARRDHEVSALHVAVIIPLSLPQHAVADGNSTRHDIPNPVARIFFGADVSGENNLTYLVCVRRHGLASRCLGPRQVASASVRAKVVVLLLRVVVDPALQTEDTQARQEQ
eukprot:COSAG03_NODE_6754_length_1010_cov_1.683864_1_plen_195_part_10